MLALLLVLSAALFTIGIYLERSSQSTPGLASGTPTQQPEASASGEETGGETGEAGHSERPVATNGETDAESAGEQSPEARPFGIDLESPLPVGGAIVASLVLAVAVLALATPLVSLATIGFAIVSGLFDLLEVSYKLATSQTLLALIALVLVAIHVACVAIAWRLFLDSRRGELVAR